MAFFAAYLRYVLPLAAVLGLSFFAVPARALTLYGLDGSANTGNPGNGSPWEAVGLTGNGSCVYLGNGYVLTANHVAVGPTVAFEGGTYSRDTGFTPVQIAPGVDAKVFRLTSAPIGLQGVTLYGGANELGAVVTQIGWGVGRNPADTDYGPNPLPITVTWGGGRDQRWGDNAVSALLPNQNVAGYVYDALEVVLDSTNGVNEAGFTTGDSGSGMFAFLGGQWQLIGLNTAVTTNGSSTFGGLGADANVAVRISSYRSQILTLVPEPASFSLLVGGGLWVLLRRPKRKRKA